MKKSYIWVINESNINETIIEIEIFVGRNKYTKKGIFSGPLRRKTLYNNSEDNIISSVFNIKGISQIGKNTLAIKKATISHLFKYFEYNEIDSVYYRMEDKKLHHIDKFVMLTEINTNYFYYDDIKRSLKYSFDLDKNEIVLIEDINPVAKLYLNIDKNNIRGYLNFSYSNIEIPYDSKQTHFYIDRNLILRNLEKEKVVCEQILMIAGKKSYRNEIIFDYKDFFDETLHSLQKINILLYWGEKEKGKKIKNISFNLSLNYNTDWFELEGDVGMGEDIISLSDLIRMSKGKKFVEIDDEIVFIPKYMNAILKSQIKDEKIRVDKNKFMDILDIATNYTSNINSVIEKIFSKIDSECHINLSPSVDLKNFQYEGVKWILNSYKRNIGCCLADDMGLGKTIQAIAFLTCKEKKNDLPSIIVVPKIVLYNWEMEFKKFAPMCNINIIYGNYDYDSNIKSNSETEIYLTTYDTVVNHTDFFASTLFDTLIIDEAQYVKNNRSKRYYSINKIKRRFTLALSGTPIENNLGELWAISNILNEGMFGSKSRFINRFMDDNDERKKYIDLNSIISLFFLRRTKEKVLKDLPLKKEEYVYCNMEYDQRNLYNYLLLSTQEEIKAKGGRYKIKDNTYILQALLYLREICSEPQLLPQNLRGTKKTSSCKFEMFKDFASEIVVNDKLIIFSQFPKLLQKLKKWSDNQGWKTFYIDGKTKHREDIVNEFEKEATGIFFISLKAGGVGLNLTSCQYVIIYEPWWNIATEEQASNRIYRIGQKKPVFIYRFIIKNSIEEKIYKLQKYKKNLFDNLMNDLEGSREISMEDICKILLGENIYEE